MSKYSKFNQIPTRSSRPQEESAVSELSQSEVVTEEASDADAQVPALRYFLDIVYDVADGAVSMDQARERLRERFGTAKMTEIGQVTFMSGRVQSAISNLYRVFIEVAGKDNV